MILVVRLDVAVSRLRNDRYEGVAFMWVHDLRPTPGPTYSAVTALAVRVHCRNLESGGYEQVRAVFLRRLVIDRPL